VPSAFTKLMMVGHRAAIVVVGTPPTKRGCHEEWDNSVGSDDQGRRVIIEWTASL
jgi:hypothetical protein